MLRQKICRKGVRHVFAASVGTLLLIGLSACGGGGGGGSTQTPPPPPPPPPAPSTTWDDMNWDEGQWA